MLMDPSDFTVTRTVVAGRSLARTTVTLRDPAVMSKVEPRGTLDVNVITAWPFASNVPVPTTVPFSVAVTGVPFKAFVDRT